MSIEVLRPALQDALTDGLVRMFEVTDKDRDLTLDEALVVIDQDTHWIAPSDDEDDMTVIYGLVTTAAATHSSFVSCAHVSDNDSAGL